VFSISRLTYAGWQQRSCPSSLSSHLPPPPTRDPILIPATTTAHITSGHLSFSRQTSSGDTLLITLPVISIYQSIQLRFISPFQSANTPRMPYPSPSLQPQRRPVQHSNNTSPPATQHTQMIQPPQFNAFPTSPLAHLPAPCRQLHPPKSPLYRPAVLRSIERPARRENSPLTPPTSSAASVDGDYVGDGEYKNGMDIRNAGYGYLGREDYGIAGLEEEGKVTGPPGKGHWKV